MSKRLAAVAVALLLTVTLTSVVFAGNKQKKGSAGAMELLIPVGSRITGMGGTGGAIVTGNEAIFWNPAGLAGSPAAAEATFSHLRWIADTAVEWFAVSAKFGQIGAFERFAHALDDETAHVLVLTLVEAKSRMPGQHFIEQQPQSVDIRSIADRPVTRDQFRRRVGRYAELLHPCGVDSRTFA